MSKVQTEDEQVEKEGDEEEVSEPQPPTEIDNTMDVEEETE